MSWSLLPPHIRATAEAELTRKQLDVLKLHLAGCGYGRIAIMLDISPSTARQHLKRAKQKLEQHIPRQEAA